MRRGLVARRSVAVLIAVSLVVTLAACQPTDPGPGNLSGDGGIWKGVRPAPVAVAEGRLAVFKVNGSGRLEYQVQARAMTASVADDHMFTGWLAPVEIPSGELKGSVSAAKNANGTIEVLGIGTNDRLYRLRQTTVDPALAASSWGEWELLPEFGDGIKPKGSPLLTEIDGDSNRDVVVLASDGNFWTTRQTATGYAAWTRQFGAELDLHGAPGLVDRGNGRIHLWFTTKEGALRETWYDRNEARWAPAQFASFGGSNWKSSPTSFKTTSGRVTVAGSGGGKDLLVQQFIPTGAVAVVGGGSNGSPAAVETAGKAYLFTVRDDARMQFAAVNDSGVPGPFYVLGQPDVPSLQSPADGAQVFAGSDVTLTASSVSGGDEYHFELVEVGGSTTPVATAAQPSPVWTIPGGTMIGGKTYRWSVRAHSTATGLTSWYRTRTLTAIVTVAAPPRVAPSEGSVIDPYGSISLRARTVHGATHYRFTIARTDQPTVNVWDSTVASSAAPGSDVVAVVPGGTLLVGRQYRWAVSPYVGTTLHPSSGTCCSTFYTHTGAQASSMIAMTRTGQGYWQLTPAGVVVAFGDAQNMGMPNSQAFVEGNSAVGITRRPRSANAYWIVGEDGGIFSYGGAPYLGNARQMLRAGHYAVGMAPTATGNGYWILADDGSVYSFGDAAYHGNALGILQGSNTAVSIAPTRTGGGYVILARDGAVYASNPATGPFGDAGYYGNATGSTGIGGIGGDHAVTLQTSSTQPGYWIAGAKGSLFAFGNGFYGSALATPNRVAGVNEIDGFVSVPDGVGYIFSAQDGGVFAGYNDSSGYHHYGSGRFYGSWNSEVTPAQPSSPANGYRFFPSTPSMPTLAASGATVVGGGGGTLYYRFEVSTDPGFAGDQIVAQSGQLTNPSWTPPPKDLPDGKTYYWRVATWKTGGGAVYSYARTFQVERRFGASEPSPYEQVGPVTVNLASGNLVAGWSSPQVNGAGLELTYNSLAPAEVQTGGLPRGWTASWAGDTDAQSLLASNGTVTIVMADGSKENFVASSTGGLGVSWLPADGSDSTLTEVPGQRWVYTTPDGTVHEFDPTGSLLSTTLPVDQRKSSSLVYGWADTPVGRRIATATDPISQRAMQFYFQGDGRGGCPTSAPGGSVAAPSGLLCAIRLMDDRTYSFWYSTSAPAQAQIAWVIGSDGTVTAFDWEVGNVAPLGGQYSRLIRVLDQLAFDAVITGRRSNDATVRTAVLYGSDGRVQRITRPAPTAGATRQTIDVTYTSNGATVTRSGDVGPNGYSRQVQFDTLGRTTLDRDQLGRTSTKGWRPEAEAGDAVAWEQDAAGMRTGTQYDDQYKVTATWGPAPSGRFAASDASNQYGAIPTSANQAATPVERTGYDEGLNGLALSFFATPDLTGGIKRRAFHANHTFDIGGGGYDGLPVDGWSMRAEGLITIPTTGEWGFHATADGGARVYVNDLLVANGWDLPDGSVLASPAGRPKIQLEAGKRVKVRVEYRDRGGNGAVGLLWEPPGGTAAKIPVARLQPNYGLATSTQDPDGRHKRFEYADPSTGLVTSTVAVVGGGKANLVSTTSYEPDGTGWRRQTSRTLPAGESSRVSYEYYGDTAGPVANACGVSGINQAGRTRSTTAADPDGAGPEVALRRWYVYDAAGRTRGLLTTTANIAEGGLGSQPWICTSYDARGRTSGVTYPAFGGAAARTVTYDYSNPFVTGVTDPAGTITSEVDLLGRPTRYVDVFGTTTTTTYGQADRVVTSMTSGHVTSYTYEADGQVNTVSIDGVVAADTAYAADGRLTSVAYPAGASGNGTGGTFTYDTLLRPSGVTWHTTGGTVIASETVERLLSGNLRKQSFDGIVTNGTSPDFTYDGAGRLTSAVVRDGLVASRVRNYTYNFADSAGCGSAGAGLNSNRTSKTVDGVTTNYCYDFADRLISSTEAGLGTPTHDTHGNTTTLFGEAHSYDVADRHTGTTKGATAVAYVWDATDRIVERRLNGQPVARYLSSGSGDAPDLVTDVAAGKTSWTYSLPGGVLLTRDPTAPADATWSYSNLQGSILAQAGTDGAKIGNTNIWDPDGNQALGAQPETRPGNMDDGWLGRHQRPLEHEAGLAPIVEMGARQYSPVLGRFLEVDPVEGGTANDYAYVDDPVNEVDLDGNCRMRRGWRYKIQNARCSAARRVAAIRRPIARVAGRATRNAVSQVVGFRCVAFAGTGRYGPCARSIDRTGASAGRTVQHFIDKGANRHLCQVRTAAGASLWAAGKRDLAKKAVGRFGFAIVYCVLSDG